MPSTFTHYLLANKVYERLSENEIKYIDLIRKFKKLKGEEVDLFDSNHKNVFLWGAQGPDYLFMVSPLPWKNQKLLSGYGSRLHSLPPSVTLENMRNIVKGFNDNRYIFYSMGFICHYALDSIAHPFIKYNSEVMQRSLKHINARTAHANIETNLDNIILRHEKNVLPISVDIDEVLPLNDYVSGCIAEIYVPLLKILFGDLNISDVEFEDILKQVVYRYKRALVISKDETTLKKRFLKSFENKLKIPPYFSSYIRGFTEESSFDFANLSHSRWHWPLSSKKYCNDSFLDLFNKAQDKSIEIIDGFLSGKMMKKVTKDKPFV